MSATTDGKTSLRAEAKARRANLQNEAHAAAGALAAHLIDHFKNRDIETIAGYWPIGDEMDLRPSFELLAKSGLELALPAIVKSKSPLVFRRWRPGDELKDGLHHTKEPSTNAAEICPKVLLVPLLAFDSSGGRLGYGGGYYDRTLAALRKDGHITAIGIAFSGQQIDRVPIVATDQKLDWIATELGVWKCDRVH